MCLGCAVRPVQADAANDNIKVVVRVRPLSGDEMAKAATNAISVNEHFTALTVGLLAAPTYMHGRCGWSCAEEHVWAAAARGGSRRLLCKLSRRLAMSICCDQCCTGR